MAVKKFSSVQHLKQVTVVVFQKEMAAEFVTELKNTAGIHRHRERSSVADCKFVKDKLKPLSLASD